MINAQVARAAADPAPVPQAAQPGGWDGLVYYRLHGSPEMYTSAYSASYLDTLNQVLSAAAQTLPTWCIFDNTTLGAATANALDLCARLSQPGQEHAVLASVQLAQTVDSYSGERE